MEPRAPEVRETAEEAPMTAELTNEPAAPPAEQSVPSVPPDLLACALEHLLGELAGRALEGADLGDAPVDRVVVGVADLFDHPAARALDRARRA